MARFVHFIDGGREFIINTDHVTFVRSHANERRDGAAWKVGVCVTGMTEKDAMWMYFHTKEEKERFMEALTSNKQDMVSFNIPFNYLKSSEGVSSVRRRNVFVDDFIEEDSTIAE